MAFIVGLLEFVIGTVNQAFNSTTSLGLEGLIDSHSFIAGILGIVGGAVEMKKGGILMTTG